MESDSDTSQKYMLNSKRKKAARFSALFGGLIAGLVILVASWAYLNPLEWAELKSRFDFRRETGAVATDLDGMIGFQKLQSTRPEPDLCWIFIHGNGDSLTTWKRFIRVIPPETRWIAFDLPGQGGNRKERTLERYRVSLVSERVFQGLESDIEISKKCEKFRLIANSFGGWVALKMALLKPELLESVVILGGVGIQKPELPKLPIFSEPTVEALKDFQAKAYFKPRELPDSIWLAALERAKKSEVPRIREAQTEADFLDGKLSRLKTPIFYFHGDSDRIVPKEYAQSLVSQISGVGARLYKLKECGHMPQKECPEQLLSEMKSLGLLSQ